MAFASDTIEERYIFNYEERVPELTGSTPASARRKTPH